MPVVLEFVHLLFALHAPLRFLDRELRIGFEVRIKVYDPLAVRFPFRDASLAHAVDGRVRPAVDPLERFVKRLRPRRSHDDDVVIDVLRVVEDVLHFVQPVRQLLHEIDQLRHPRDVKLVLLFQYRVAHLRELRPADVPSVRQLHQIVDAAVLEGQFVHAFGMGDAV